MHDLGNIKKNLINSFLRIAKTCLLYIALL